MNLSKTEMLQQAPRKYVIKTKEQRKKEILAKVKEKKEKKVKNK